MSSSELSVCKQPLKSRIIYEPATFCPLDVHSDFASQFDLLFICFESEKASVNLPALHWNSLHFSHVAGCLVSLTVSFDFWACFLSLILFACPRVNGEAFDINTKPEACMFLCSFLTASSVSEGLSVF